MPESSNHEARRVIWTGFVSNLFLAVGKMTVGIFANSVALKADAINSVSDVATDLIVVGGLAYSSKPVDHNHKYGHGKVETLVTGFIGVALMVVGAGLMFGGAMKIYSVLQGEILREPGMAAFYAALASVIIKEVLFRYSIREGKRLNSQAVCASAWHHRSDVYSSFGTLLGISGAIFLGQKWTILDPIAAVIVSVFIFRIAIIITRDSLLDLIDTSLPREQEKEIIRLALLVEGVHDPHDLKTRRIGNQIAIDIHIKVDNKLNIEEAHVITMNLENKFRNTYGNDTHISIHAEPLINNIK